MELEPIPAKDKKQVNMRFHPKIYGRASLYLAHTNPDIRFTEYVERLVETDMDRVELENPGMSELFKLSESIKGAAAP